MVLVANKLFATLDTTVRALHPESAAGAGERHRGLHQEPAARPGGLVQVDARRGARGIAARPRGRCQRPGFERQLAVTEEVLDEIGAKDVPRLLVFNKIDRGGNEEELRFAARKVSQLHRDERQARGRRRQAARGDRGVLPARPGRGRAVPPWSAQNLRGEIFASCQVIGSAPTAREPSSARRRRSGSACGNCCRSYRTETWAKNCGYTGGLSCAPSKSRGTHERRLRIADHHGRRRRRGLQPRAALVHRLPRRRRRSHPGGAAG